MGSWCFCWKLIVDRFGGSFCKEQIVESFAFAWDSWEASGRSLCCLERCTHTRLLCAAICAFCALFCFVQLPSPCSRTATKKPTWLLCGAARPHAILYSGLGRKILSGIVVLFSRSCRRKVHNGKRGELLWEVPRTFMTTSQPVSRCTRLHNYNNNHAKLWYTKIQKCKKIHPCHHRYKGPDCWLENKRRQKPADIHKNLAEEGTE